MGQNRNVYVCVTEDNDWYTQGAGPLLAYRSKEEAIAAMERTGAPKVRKYTVDGEGDLIKTEDFFPNRSE